uniref:Sushi domain-containing protein n=2 Tax=Takifugu rubripes TaxID=31033 RepID=A0A674P4K4_TAKRU
MEITRTIIAVCLGLVVASQAQDCSKPVPGPNMDLKDSDIVLTTFPDGSRATFVCSLGYTTAVGSRVVTCTAGTWSQVTLQCKKKICGSPGQVDNGEIKYLSENEFGDRIVVTCNLGFRLVGKRELICGDQGWLGRLPVCEVVTCDLPAGIPNGLFKPVKDVYNYREVVQYSCTGDFTLSGSKSVTCSEDGTFTPGLPQCTEVECADPKVANGEWVSGSRPPHKYLATVTYRCNAGYKMEGDASMECGLNGQWMPGIPKCTAVTCSPPSTITSGTFSPQKPLYQYLETVAYSCDQGFTLSGSKSLSCSLDGTFNGSPPTCNKKTCGSAGQVDNGEIEYLPGKEFGDKLVVTCNPGFRLVGKRELTCGDQGWLGRLPECEEVECSHPKVANGEWVSGSHPPHKYLDTVTYRCNAGYKMEGDATMVCSLNGQWTPGIPKCTAVTCSPPPTITSGTFSPQKPLYQYLETVAYSCDQGFTLSGSKSLSCSLDGTFNGSPPTCNTVTCSPPPTITSGTFSPQKPLYQYQEMVEYSCDQGFTLSGSKSLSCSLDGTFNGSPPTCSSRPSPTAVVGTLVALTGVGGIVGFLVYWNKRQSSRKDLHGKQGTETEEEVALSEGKGGAETIRRVWPCLSYCSLAACFTVSCCFRGSCLWNG